jgi:hypothetical protein
MGSYSKMCEDSGYGDELYQRYSPSSDRSIVEKDLKILSLLREKEVCIPSALCAASAEDYNDALTILNWDNNSFGVSKSEGISRMNEVKCHEHWAYRIKTLGDIYGIKESVNEKLI